MAQWEKLLKYCDSNLLLMFNTKPVKESKPANEEIVDANENGLNFAPLCDGFCFTKKKECDHKKKNIQINNVGKKSNFLPSGITKDTSMMFGERLLSKRNYLQGQVLHQSACTINMRTGLKIKSSKDSCLLKQ